MLERKNSEILSLNMKKLILLHFAWKNSQRLQYESFFYHYAILFRIRAFLRQEERQKTFKDRILAFLLFAIVYKCQYGSDNATYYSKTKHHFKVRMYE